MDIAPRIAALRRRIDELNVAYHVHDNPKASDAEYDALVRELAELEALHPDLQSPASPTRQVGAPPRGDFAEVRHREPMLSIENALNEGEVRDFVTRVAKDLGPDHPLSFVIEPKIDGIGLSLTYEGGRLTRAATRGDGETGEDITANVRTIRSVPHTLRVAALAPPPDIVEVRGEAFTRVAAFHDFNAARTEAEGRYANPRNFTGGSIRQLDSAVTAARPIEAFFYAAGALKGAEVASQQELLDAFESWGLPIARPWIRFATTADGVVSAWRDLEARRDDVPFEIDGAVVKVDAFALRRILGSRTRTPRWAVAAKFAARQASTRLLAIDVGVGRTGVLTPVAVLEPVPLAGVTISSASLHNLDEIRRLDARIGDRVLVERAGDVIPKVVKVLSAERTGNEIVFDMPDTCPSCGTPVTRDEGLVLLRCSNARCPAQVKGRIIHFASKNAVDIHGLGEKLVDQLVDRGLVGDVADVYALDEASLAELDRMGDLSARNLLAAILGSKEPPLDRLIFGLGIRHVGEHAARVLATFAETLDRFATLTFDDIVELHGLGDEVARAVADFNASADNQAMLKRLKERDVRPRPVRATGAGVFAGKTFCVTGTLPSFDRKGAENFIRLHGGKPVSAVSKTTNFLVAGEKAGSKRAKAEALGVTVIDEETLLRMAAAPPA